MPKETIFLYNTSEEKAIDCLISNYGFKHVLTQENTFGSHYIGLVSLPSIIELGPLQQVKLKVEKESKLLKIIIVASYRQINIIYGIIICLAIGLTLLILTWPYVFLFILFPLIFYVAGLINFYAHFYSFCEKLKNDIINQRFQNL